VRELALHKVGHFALATTEGASKESQLFFLAQIAVLTERQRRRGDTAPSAVSSVGVAPAIPARVAGKEAGQPASLKHAKGTANHRHESPRHAHSVAAAAAMRAKGPSQSNGRARE
jgi:hypothetical protein